MSKKLDRIARILADQDVRDPRNTLDAIANVIDQQVPSLTSEDINRNEQAKAKLVPHRVPACPFTDHDNPVGTLYIYNDPDGPGPLKVVTHFEYCGHHLEQRHIHSALVMLDEFDAEMSA